MQKTKDVWVSASQVDSFVTPLPRTKIEGPCKRRNSLNPGQFLSHYTEFMDAQKNYGLRYNLVVLF